MVKEVIHVPQLFSYEAHYGFEQCVAENNLVFVTGQRGINKEGVIVSDDIERQAEITFQNIQHALRAAKTDLENILSMTCYIVDIKKNGPLFWSTRMRMMPTVYFTSATIGVAELADPRSLIEIQCIASR